MPIAHPTIGCPLCFLRLEEQKSMPQWGRTSASDALGQLTQSPVSPMGESNVQNFCVVLGNAFAAEC